MACGASSRMEAIRARTANISPTTPGALRFRQLARVQFCQTGFGVVQPASMSERPGVEDAESGPRPHQFVGQGFEPAQHGRVVSPRPPGATGLLDQVGYPLVVSSGRCIIDGFVGVGVFLVPEAGTVV